MMSSPNLYPNYPVARLDDDRVPQNVIATEQIVRERDLMHEYAQPWLADSSSSVSNLPRAFFIAVRGDYGTGKTFLLRDAVDQLAQKLGKLLPIALQVVCVEADPVTWYQTEIGPKLDADMLEGVMRKVYAEAAKRIAKEVKLTEAAVDKLEKEPAAVFSLLERHLLNRTLVDAKAMEILRSDCGIVEEDVRFAFFGLLWDQTSTQALRWIQGKALEAAERECLHVAANLETDRAAAATLNALVSLHFYVGRPFALFIDELEHFFPRERRERQDANITWMKRLFEGFASAAPLVFVAGHWSAWEARPDFIDRLPAYSIDMVKLSGEQIALIVSLYSGTSAVFNQEEADAVADLTSGNIRRIMSLLRAMHEATDGFSKALERNEIKEIFESIGQKLSLEKAKFLLHELFEQRGLQVQMEPRLLGRDFSLVAYHAGRPKVVVNLRPGLTSSDVAGELKRFLVQLDAVREKFQGVIGCYITDGNVDDTVTSLLEKQNLNVLAFDLSRRDVLQRIAQELDTRLGVKAGSGASIAVEQLSVQSASLLERLDTAQEAKDTQLVRALEIERDVIAKQIELLNTSYAKQTRALEEQFGAIESKRLAEADELRRRIEELSKDLSSERDRTVAEFSKPPEAEARVHVTYADLTRRPTVGELVATAMDYRTWALWAASLFCAIAASFSERIAQTVLFVSKEKFMLYSSLASLVLFLVMVSFLVSAIVTGRKILLVHRFHDFRLRSLRELYARSESAELLIKIDNQMRNLLDEFGPLRAFGEARSYFSSELAKLEQEHL